MSDTDTTSTPDPFVEEIERMFAEGFTPTATPPPVDQDPVDSETPDDLEVEEQEGDEPTEEPVEEPAIPAEVPDEPVEPPAPELSPEEVAQLAQLRADLLADPALRQTIVDHYARLSTPPPGVPVQPSGAGVAATPPVPEGLDLDDPAIAALYTLVQQQSEQLNALNQSHQQLAQGWEATQRAESQSLANRARVSFQQQHSLSDADMAEVEEITYRLGVLPQLLNAVDPITRLPRTPDPLAALEQALTIAYQSTPKFQKLEADRVAAQRKTDAARKRKLAAVSGSSGSVPRSQPPANTPQDRRNQMIDEVKEAMFPSNAS